MSSSWHFLNSLINQLQFEQSLIFCLKVKLLKINFDYTYGRWFSIFEQLSLFDKLLNMRWPVVIFVSTTFFRLSQFEQLNISRNKQLHLNSKPKINNSKSDLCSLIQAFYNSKGFKTPFKFWLIEFFWSRSQSLLGPLSKRSLLFPFQEHLKDFLPICKIGKNQVLHAVNLFSCFWRQYLKVMPITIME